MRKPELPALTGIRFYAALIVFLSHVILFPGMDSVAANRPIFNLGGLGVSVFFVLSGFILTYNYADRFRTGISFADTRAFLWGRLTKIYPVHVAALLLALPLQIFSPNLPLDWRAVPCHLLLLQCFLPFPEPRLSQYLNVPSWSVSCEWFFYLLAPALIYGAFGRARRWIPVGIIVIYLTLLGWGLRHADRYTQFYFFHTFAPSRIPEFFAGILLGWLHMSAAGPRLAPAGPWLQVAGLLALAGAGYVAPNAPWVLDGGLLFLPGASLLVMGLASGRGPLAAHLRLPVLHLLGLASYSFYMFQAPLLRGLRVMALRLGWEVTSWTGFWIAAGILFVLVQLFALAAFHFYEMPVQHALRRWFRRGQVMIATEIRR